MAPQPTFKKYSLHGYTLQKNKDYSLLVKKFLKSFGAYIKPRFDAIRESEFFVTDKQTHHHNISIIYMIITLQSNPLVAKVIPSCLLAHGIVMRSTKTTRFVSKWCPEDRSALAVLPTCSPTLVGFPNCHVSGCQEHVGWGT